MGGGFQVFAVDGAGEKSAWHYECASEIQALDCYMLMGREQLE